ncbi:SMP-30/gluconolactonase/LRE family protein [Lutimonas halocynthiae]|uniref:SMP-30/gluconolactonase/LRE family protein n=1 Tax=Lutimonas halocynthiae TaxID=1446477 RepID=UPI0025B573C3|nr:SMP-30/gluconolactonase/LRE family protein [Lutimonas halocynthiae]MDN3643554.1 SMP-30/gluconolactonase/LRE family protein [Lutimonas halocynthiae]
MNIIKSILGAVSLFLIIVACEPADKSADFTKEMIFTGGIEGPAVDSENNLYAVNFEKEGTIGIVDMQGNASVFIELPNGSVGNGIRFDKQDNMYIADYVNHNVLMIPKGKKEVQVYAHHPDLNQPNDLAISPNGTLYASDPNWKESTGNLWKVDETGFSLLEAEMGTTNGVEVSPDGKKLYVNESVQRKIWSYNLDADGNPSNKTLFYEFSDFGMDGMRCDNQGNIYVCRYDAGKVVVLNPAGSIIREVSLKGKKPTNIAFGGKDGKQCFVTLQDRRCIETFMADHPGRDH